MGKEREITTFGQIKGGQIHYTKLAEFKAATLARFKEGERFIVKHIKVYKKRSSAQNRYYWGCLIPSYLQGYEETNGHKLCIEIINQQTGQILLIPVPENEQANMAHEALKQFFLTDENGNIRSTTDNTTTQQEDYHSYCREYIKFAFNIDVPLPGEQSTLAFKNQ